MKQIFINLLSNSIKFSHDGGFVTLTIHQDGERVKVMIKDEGIGIAEKDLNDITEPFFRGQAEAEIAASGTGLGLSIVRSLLDAHDGSLEIVSTEHVGTSVNIGFPIRNI